MRNIHRAATVCGFAITIMSGTPFAPALAFNVTDPPFNAAAPDTTPVTTEARPPQIASAQNDQPAPQPQEHILGTLQNDELPVASARAPSPQVDAMAAPPAMSSSDAAAASETPLQPKTSGDVTYITGGVGDEERQTLEAQKKDYKLHVMNAGTGGAFVADIRLVIRDNSGKELLDTVAGPIFYANLPSGSYTVEATSGGQVKKQKVTVGKTKSSNLHFSW